ncbi:PadR family transcriptional regulator [Amphibacillus jilinensis]|uniref:PadR family transcriptional regulator n=1 Tax=Amphibacillus jilinensis TaxID=1216008 RepID=UPI0002E0D86A|nr:PadR family transcriptional regulator [Amphibacillus jilinensis]
MLSSDTMRGYNDTIILSLLLEEPSYGYEIAKRIKERSNNKYVMKETTLYSAFTRLEKHDYICSFQQGKTMGRRRTYYEITAKGRNYFDQKHQEWLLTQEVVNQFITDNRL